MAITKWLREFPSAITSPVDLTANSTIAGDWIQLPDGGDVSFRDGSGQVQVFTALDPKDVIRSQGAFRELIGSSAKVRIGTGEGPGVAGPKGDQGDQGSPGLLQVTQAVLAADGTEGTTVTETVLGVLAITQNVFPWIQVRGGVIANSSNYATITFKLYRAGSVINTWTYSTTPSGTGDIASGGVPDFPTPFQGQTGDHITYTQTKTGTGVQLPARSYGFTCTG